MVQYIPRLSQTRWIIAKSLSPETYATQSKLRAESRWKTSESITQRPAAYTHITAYHFNRLLQCLLHFLLVSTTRPLFSRPQSFHSYCIFTSFPQFNHSSLSSTLTDRLFAWKVSYKILAEYSVSVSLDYGILRNRFEGVSSADRRCASPKPTSNLVRYLRLYIN